MKLKCLFGSHAWDGCKCRSCRKTRDEGHKWQGCKCSACGVTRDQAHKWNGCTCTICGKTRNKNHSWDGCTCRLCGKSKEHSWQGCKCSVCGVTRDEGHKWDGRTCTKCGAVRDENQNHDRVGEQVINTTNLAPNTVVPKSGLYYCCMCKDADPVLRDAVAKYAREKGVNTKMLEGVFGAAGISSNEPTTRKQFKVGDIFNQCPRHQAATGWTLEKEESTPAADPVSSAEKDHSEQSKPVDREGSKLALLAGLPCGPMEKLDLFGGGSRRLPSDQRVKSMEFVRSKINKPYGSDDAMEGIIVLDMLGANNPDDGKEIAVYLGFIAMEDLDLSVRRNSILALKLIEKLGCQGNWAGKEAARESLRIHRYEAGVIDTATCAKFLSIGATLDSELSAKTPLAHKK